MQPPERVELSKLLGFEAVSDQIEGRVDFANETIAARLGAKVGDPEGVAPARLA